MRKLKWTYDESGSKSFVASIGHMHFSLYIFLDDREKPYRLSHGYLSNIEYYKTWEEADAAAWRQALPSAQKLKAELEELGI